MSTGLVDALHQWFIEHEERLSSAGVIVEFTKVANEDARSARIDLESGSKLGRATVWEDGFCDFETINTKTDEQPQYRHYEEFDAPYLRALLDELAAQFSNPT